MKNTKKSTRKDKLDFKAALTMEVVNEFESNRTNVNIRRRATMLILTKSRSELVDGFKDRPDTLVNLIEDFINPYIEHLEGALELARSAQARLFNVGMVLTKSDFNEGATAGGAV